MYQHFKRGADAVISLLAAVVLLPLIAITACVVRATSEGPAIFRQTRAGRDGKPFTIYKFRTMYVTAPKDMPTHLLGGAGSFITPVGAVLRKFSIDELPQLLNIIKGDMAIVGPRPALPNQLDLLAEREKYGANSLRPGLTGWAQINGRDELPIPVKAALDGEYKRRMSLQFDLKCIAGTFSAVVTGKGYKEGRK